jgi:tRNA(fMet)-specific endonuclease VapC
MQRGHVGVVERIRRSWEVLLSAVVVGEQVYGFRYGRQTEKNLEQLEAFLARPVVTFLPVTRRTADHFGALAAVLRRAGRPLPTNDLWIAAHVLENGADLLTFDAHFEHIPGLLWSAPGS